MKKLLLTGFALVAVMAQAQNSWVEQATNLSANNGIKEIAIVDANTVWATAYDGAGGGTYPKVVTRTTNGGSTWVPSTVTGAGSNALISDISAINATTAWVVTAPFQGGANANKIYKTTNGGTSWTAQASGFTTGSFINHVYFWDANEGWASGDPLNGKLEMFKTTNGGTSWTLVPGRPTPENGGEEYTYVGLKKVVGNNVWIGTDIGRVLHSTDRGATWTGAYTPVLDFGGVTTAGSSGSFAFKDGNNGLLISVDGSADPLTTVAMMYSTSDGGETYDPITPNGPWYFGDIAAVPGQPNTYVSTGINSGTAAEPRPQWLGSSYSTDGGLNWTAIDSGEQRGALAFLNSTTGWAGQFSDGAGGTTGILKFSGELSLGVANNAIKSGLQIYPNPASDVVNISSKQEIQGVSIIDLSGKKVQSLKPSKQINVSSLAKGTYILQVYYNNGSVENTKFIKK